MKKKRVLLVGPCGKMGREIKKILEDSRDLSYVGGVDYKGRADFKSIKEVLARRVDIVIEFSTPKGLLETVKWCEANKIPLVSGTTGLTNGEISKLKKASKKTAILWSANMSRGVALMVQLIQSFAPLKSDFDFQIEEIHHKKKKDNPSGTALLLQSEAEKALQKKLPRPIGIRGGGVFGEHSFFAIGQDEMIVIKHVALNRAVFARGAVLAAQWLSGVWSKRKSPGLFSVKEMFGEK